MKITKRFLISAVVLAAANGVAADDMDDINAQISSLRQEIDDLRAARHTVIECRLLRHSDFVRYIEMAPRIDSMRAQNKRLEARAAELLRRRNGGVCVTSGPGVWVIGANDYDICALRQAYDNNRHTISAFDKKQERINSLIRRVKNKCDSVMYAKIDSCQQKMDSLLTKKWEMVR